MINSTVSSEICPLNHIYSFSRRRGRLTKGQRYALNNYWSMMGIDFHDKLLDYTTIYGCDAPIILEIGFGMGASLVATAKSRPDLYFLGIEIYFPGVGACLSMAYKEGVNNLRVICHDAVEVIYTMIPDNSLNAVQLFFPDPWHKKRHNKRRIIQPVFAKLVKEKLKFGGTFHIATDWQPYAKHILEVMSSLRCYKNKSPTNDYIPRPECRPITKFEQRAHYLGHKVWDLMFERIM